MEKFVITPQIVKEAFETTGLTPVVERFGDMEFCGCALTALYVSVSTKEEIEELDVAANSASTCNPLDLIRKKINWEEDELVEFMTGFDFGLEAEDWINASPNRKLGAETRKLIFGEDDN